MTYYQPYELSDALQELEYETGDILPDRFRIIMTALLKRIEDLESALRGHGHDGFRRY